MNVKEALHQLVDLFVLHPTTSAQAHDLVEKIDVGEQKAAEPAAAPAPQAEQERGVSEQT